MMVVVACAIGLRLSQNLNRTRLLYSRTLNVANTGFINICVHLTSVLSFVFQATVYM